MANTNEYERDRADSRIGKIIVDRDLCIAAAACIAVSGSTFEFDNENKAVVIDANAADDDTLIMACESCPTKAICLKGKDGSTVYPK